MKMIMIKGFTITAGIILLMLPLVCAENITVLTEEMPPYNYTDQGQIKGIATEVVKTVLNKTGHEYTIASYPWKRAYLMALKNPNTLIYSIGRNVKREPSFKWVGVIAPVKIYIWKLSSRHDIVISTVEDSFLYQVSGGLEDYTMQYLTSKGHKRLDPLRSYTLAIRKLYGLRTDLIIIDELTLRSLIKKEKASGAPFRMDTLEKALYINNLSSDMYMAFSLKTPDDLVDSCRKVLLELKRSGEYERIVQSYLGRD